MTAHLTLLDSRTDVIPMPRSKVEEVGMDLTSLGVETVKAVEQVWRYAAAGDFAAMAQWLSRLEAKGHDCIARGRAIAGDAKEAPCVDGIRKPGHGRAA